MAVLLALALVVSVQLPSDKAALTPAQRKIDSQLLRAIAGERRTIVKVDAKGRALVDVRGEVSAALRKTIVSLGGEIVSTSTGPRSILARVPLLKLEALAEDASVTFIAPAPQAITNRPPGVPE